MEENYKEVYLGQYCKTCLNQKVAEKDEPCHECLDNQINLYSHIPVKYEKK